MKRFGRVFGLQLLGAVLFLALPLFTAAPAQAQEQIIGAALGARTANGNGGSKQAGNWRRYQVTVRVTSGSGTVNPFRVWLEGTPDGGLVWYEIACYNVLKSGGAAPGTANTVAQRDIVNETAVVTSGAFTAICETYFPMIRAVWAISGTTPSETFEVLLSAK